MKKILSGVLLMFFAGLFAWGLTPEDGAKSQNDRVIPFELKGHSILIKCRINDAQEAYDFVVDTGGLTFIDKALADQLTLKQQGPQAKIQTLLIGDYPFENVFAMTAFDPKFFKTASGITVHGMIGSDFLENYLVTLDYEKQRLILSSAAESLAGEEINGKGYLFKFKNLMFNNAPMIKCRLNGAVEVEAMIDTGQPFLLALPLDLLEKTGALKRPETIKAKGVMGKWPMTKSTDNYLSRLTKWEAGGLTMNNVATLYAELPARLSLALLGKDFLSRFLIKINYPKDEILLVPRPEGRSADNLYSAGFSMKRDADGHVVVRGVWEKSPADEAGIEVGDRILEFNSKKLTPESQQEFYLLLQDDRVKSIEVAIQKSDGPKKIILKKRNLLN